MARQLGATHTVNPSQGDPEAALKDMTDQTGVDAALDCTGAIPVIESLFRVIASGGVAVTVGAPRGGRKIEAPTTNIILRNMSYLFCHQGHSYPPEASHCRPASRCLDIHG
ncbi:hypothetical protein BJ546DRAFT_164047 [Cryomyces antarcticus]